MAFTKAALLLAGILAVSALGVGIYAWRADAVASTPESWWSEGKAPGVPAFAPRSAAPMEASLELGSATVAPDGQVTATLRNTGDAPIPVSGSACGLHFARATPKGWLVFASPSGAMAQTLGQVEPGASCTVTLSMLDHVGFGTGPEPLPPGTYRLAYVAVGEPARVVFATLTVRA